MKSKHTPGPWSIDYEDWGKPNYRQIDAPTHGALAEVVWRMEGDCRENKNSPEREANAHLIAAAPELLEALEALEPYLDSLLCYASTMGEYEPNKLVFNTKRAIAKAKGDAI